MKTRTGTGHGDAHSAWHAVSFEEWMQRWIDGENLWNGIGLCGEPKFGFEEYGDGDARVH